MNPLSVKVFTGKIYTSFKPLKVVRCLVVAFGRVIYAGSDNICEYICKNTLCDNINIDGIALPGFVDSHIHMDTIGIKLNSLDMRNLKSIEDVKNILKVYRNTIGNWIVGLGWDQERFLERRPLTRYDIDEVSSEMPIMLIRICGHLGVVNSKAIEVLKLDKIFKDNPNIDIEKGIVKEDILEYIWNNIDMDIDLNGYRKLLNDAQRYIIRYGVTSIGFTSVPISVLPALISMDLENKLIVKTHLYMDFTSSDIFKSIGLKRGFGDDFLRFMGIKIFIDGSLGARTALLSKPYSDEPNNFGIERVSSDILSLILYNSKCKGIDVAIHAIGDKALDIALDSIWSSLSTDFTRVEHASIVRDDQLYKLKGLRIALQPHFIISDFWVLDRVGVERAQWVYRIKSLVNSNALIGFSTDAPIEDINPWKTIYAATTRGIYENIELAKYTFNEAIDVIEALHLYTRGSAALLKRNDIGCLEPGCYADVIVVDRDPLNIDLFELKNIETLKVFVNGNLVFS